jgi:hypothetical protein
MPFKLNLRTYNTSINLQIKKGTIKMILQSTEAGKEFLRDIDQTSKLGIKESEQLMSLVICYYLGRNIDIKLKEVILLAKMIHEEFEKEPASAYCDEQTKTGPLLHKLNNMKRTMRAKKLLEPARKRKLPDATHEAVTAYTEDEMEADRDVNICAASMEFSILKQHWTLSSRLRLNKFRTENELQFSELYPALKRPDGYKLVRTIV